MSGSLKICAVSEEVKNRLKEFRFRKADCSAALILKIERGEQCVVVDDELHDCSLADVAAALPSQQPRFVLVSYRLEHSDGRLSFPLCFVFFSPQGCSPEIKMLYAGSRTGLVQECGLTKNFEIREVDELNDEFLRDKLSVS